MTSLHYSPYLSRWLCLAYSGEDNDLESALCLSIFFAYFQNLFFFFFALVYYVFPVIGETEFLLTDRNRSDMSPDIPALK